MSELLLKALLIAVVWILSAVTCLTISDKFPTKMLAWVITGTLICFVVMIVYLVYVSLGLYFAILIAAPFTVMIVALIDATKELGR